MRPAGRSHSYQPIPPFTKHIFIQSAFSIWISCLCLFTLSVAILLNTADIILIRDRVTKPTASIPRQSGLVPLMCRSVALNCTRPRARLQPTERPVSRKTGLPRPPRDRTAHRSTPPSLPLHSGSQVSSLRGIEWRDRSGFPFSEPLTANSPN